MTIPPQTGQSEARPRATILTELGVEPVINATGPWTTMGNASLSPRVVAAMQEMSAAFIPMSELQDAVSRMVAGATGAEAGYALPGAAAGLTLCVAACIAGEDPERIKALPRIDDPPHTVVMFKQHRGYYDVALRATGARLRLVDAAASDPLAYLRAALNPDAACVFFDCTGPPYKDPSGVPPLVEVAAVAHAAGIPVVADASMALPPAENLRAIVTAGADAVAFAGSKAIQGPPASGFIACRRALLRSMVLQHQDLDVLAETTGRADPDNRFMGLGRSLKIGKEQIAGLIVALHDYVARDHATDTRRWRAALETIEAAVAGVPGVARRWLISEEGRAPYLLLSFEGPLAGLAPAVLSERLMADRPRIFAAVHHGPALWLGAECLKDGEAETVGRRLVKTINAMAKAD